VSNTLLLVGCGQMGGAMLEGWLDADKVETCIIIEPAQHVAARFRDWNQVEILADPTDIPSDFKPDIVVFAVKPQAMDSAVPAYRKLVRKETVFLSIAAGKPISYFTRHLGPEAAVIRAMPNTPAAVRAGITVCVENPHVTPEEHELAEYLLSSVGQVEWVDDERLLDAVTAVSGSGPAYVFLLMEELAKAGSLAGLPAELSARLARQTVIGAALLARQSQLEPERLRQNVTSPGGTTAAALNLLMDEEGGLPPLMERAVAAAAARSKELAG
jgi:pyrroline-5-carboxylate reductase